MISGLLYALGSIFQKKGVKDIPKIKFDNLNSLINMLKNRDWILGILLSLSGTPFYIIGQSFIGIALSQPLSLTFQLIFTVMLGFILVREKLSRMEILGFFMLLSTPILFFFSGVGSPSIMLDNIRFFQNFTLFSVVVLVLCGLFILLASFCKNLDRKKKVLYYSVIAGIIFGFGNNLSQFGVEMVKIKGSDNLAIGIFIIGLSLGLSLIATIFLQKSFQGGKTATSLAISAILSLLFTVSGGIFLFNQDVLILPLFIISISFLLMGIIILFKFQAKISEFE